MNYIKINFYQNAENMFVEMSFSQKRLVKMIFAKQLSYKSIHYI